MELVRPFNVLTMKSKPSLTKIQAKRLFERLGYELDHSDDYCLVYKAKSEVSPISRIIFYNHTEDIQIETKSKPKDGNPYISLSLLNTINLQIQELEWNPIGFRTPQP